MQALPDLWIWSTDCNFYNFPCKEFINRRAMHKFEISRRNERKPQPQVAWPVAMFIKDNLAKVLSASQDRNELSRGKQVPFYHASFKRLSNSAVATSLDFEHGLDCKFYNFLCKEFIYGQAICKLEISRRNKTKLG